MSNIVTRPSSVYADNFDSIFKNKKVYYTVEFTDEFRDYLTFDSDKDALIYYANNKEHIVEFLKQELLEG